MIIKKLFYTIFMKHFLRKKQKYISQITTLSKKYFVCILFSPNYHLKYKINICYRSVTHWQLVFQCIKIENIFMCLLLVIITHTFRRNDKHRWNSQPRVLEFESSEMTLIMTYMNQARVNNWTFFVTIL
jgi:hypothetical protein